MTRIVRLAKRVLAAMRASRTGPREALRNHRRGAGIAICVALATIVALPTLALAHAAVLASQPPAGAVVNARRVRYG